VMGIAGAAGVVVSIENYGSLIPSSLAQAIANGMIARPDHSPHPLSCETKSVATTSPRTTGSLPARPGSESAGLWVAQLGSSNSLGNADALVADLKKLQQLVGSSPTCSATIGPRLSTSPTGHLLPQWLPIKATRSRPMHPPQTCHAIQLLGSQTQSAEKRRLGIDRPRQRGTPPPAGGYAIGTAQRRRPATKPGPGLLSCCYSVGSSTGSGFHFRPIKSISPKHKSHTSE
jgi:hypothetical protein